MFGSISSDFLAQFARRDSFFYIQGTCNRIIPRDWKNVEAGPQLFGTDLARDKISVLAALIRMAAGEQSCDRHEHDSAYGSCREASPESKRSDA